MTSKTQPFRLSWTHYVFLMGIKNPDERSFYEIESSEQNWNQRELRRQFDSGLYERLALSRDKEGVRRLAREGQIVSQPQDLLKEPLVLEFLGLSEQARYTESDLESAIISQIDEEMGTRRPRSRTRPLTAHKGSVHGPRQLRARRKPRALGTVVRQLLGVRGLDQIVTQKR